jgi:hypothetical protein
MRTTISAAALIIAAGLAGPVLAQTTQGGKQPAQPGVQSGQQSDSKDMTTPGSEARSGSVEAPQGGKQPAKQGVQSGQQPGAATGQGAGTSGTSGTGAAGAAAPAPGTAPEHQRSGTEDMTRAVPTMKPGDQPASTGAAQGQGPGGWTADQKLRATGKEGAVENPGPGGAGAQPPAQQPSR